MIEQYFTILDLSLWELAFMLIVAFGAGLVRGFAGFALSAMIIAFGVLILPPVELIPICWCLEVTASSLMVRRSTIKEADLKISGVLALGAGAGIPIGLLLITNISPDASKLLALALLIVLAVMQLMRIRLRFLAHPAGLIGSGLMAGLATGIANIGGLVVAIYVLAREIPARVMRASLIMYLFFGATAYLLALFWFDVMTQTAALRGASFALPAAMGVMFGKWLFVPKWEPYYKPICLAILVFVSVAGILRLLIIG